jgi:prepilin-type N-terminal cleavage/methylation domain-containing protein
MNNQGHENSSAPRCMSSSRGFSLIELIVVMAIFMVVIIITSEAFNRILSISSQQTKSSESDVQGVIGLEMMRVDLEHAGYGLPWITGFVADFAEVQEAAGSLAPGIDSKQFNDINSLAADTDSNKVTRAIQAAASTTNGRDYLAIKSILAGMNDTTKKWAFVEGTGGTSKIKPWGSNDFVDDEQVITIDSRTKRLIGTSMTASEFSYPITASNMTPPIAFQPEQDTNAYVVYGVTTSDTPRAPYNRVDYYVKRPTDASKIPTRCAPGTGILYKAVMKHGDGLFTEYPLLECVADMQVVFNVVTDGDVGVDVEQSGLAGLSARQIRQQLKMIKIYIVAHEGGKDRGFSYATQNLVVGEGNGRPSPNDPNPLDLNALVGPDYKNYRWKTYKLSVVPKNINF